MAASNKMIAPLLGLVVTASLMGSSAVEAALFCFGDDDPVLDEWTLRDERLPVDERLMGEVYEVIDGYLMNKITDDDSAQRNLREIRRLLRNEIEAKEGALCSKLPGRVCISDLMRTEDRSVAINALLRLNDLAKIAESKLPICIDYTNYLIENNRIAGDPIGRRKSNQTDWHRRLDGLIFGIALGRTQIALPEYRQLMRTVTTLRTFTIMEELWKPIVERRLGGAVDLEFSRDPLGALSWVKAMPAAFGDSELPIFHDFVGLQRSYSYALRTLPMTAPVGYEMIIKPPCLDYVDIVANLVTSLEFSMRLTEFLPAELRQLIENDWLVHKAQAYYALCVQLIAAQDAFVDAYRNYLIKIRTDRINKALCLS